MLKNDIILKYQNEPAKLASSVESIIKLKKSYGDIGAHKLRLSDEIVSVYDTSDSKESEHSFEHLKIFDLNKNLKGIFIALRGLSKDREIGAVPKNTFNDFALGMKKYPTSETKHSGYIGWELCTRRFRVSRCLHEGYQYVYNNQIS